VLAALVAYVPDVRADDGETKMSSQEIGARLGIEAGGRTSPGGVHMTGSYLHRLSEADWLDSGVGFTLGGDSAECFRDRDGELLCDHGVFSGGAIEAIAAVRRVFAPQGKFAPYARLGVALRVIRFADDDLSGFGVPLLFGGGVRATVADRIAVVGAADVRTGVGFFGRDLGVEPQWSLAISAGVEFALR